MIQPPEMNRKIAAILAADVASYSRLVANDEEAALRRLMAAHELFRTTVTTHRGRVFSTAGDAILAEFPSAVEATRAALEVQGAMAERNAALPTEEQLIFRIGLNIGDVVEHDGDLLGDGVNVAARLQAIAPEGGLAVTSWVKEQTAGKVTVAFRDAGRQALKNIPSPVHVFVTDLKRAPSAPVAAREALQTSQQSRLRPAVIAAAAVTLAPLALAATQALKSPSDPVARGKAGHEQAAPKMPASAPQSAAVPPPEPAPTGQAAKPALPDKAREPDAAAAPPRTPIVVAPAPDPVVRPAQADPVQPPQPQTAPSVAAQGSSAERARKGQTCAEILQRAQLGELSADDRAFLRSNCR